MSLRLRRLGAVLAVQVNGLDLARDHPEDLWGELERAVAEHCVLVFRDQRLEPLRVVQLCDQLGSSMEHWSITPQLLSPDTPKAYLLSSRRGGSRYAGSAWHSDYSFIEDPADFSCLYLSKVPEVGGDTAFANMYAAYEALSDRMKVMLEGLHAVHDNAHRYHLQYLADDAPVDKSTLGRLPPVKHPLVITHPLSGRKALYVSEALVETIVGLPALETKAILGFLHDHCARPQFTYRHAWRPGDLVLVDNRCTNHCAIGDYDLDEAREGFIVCGRARRTGLPPREAPCNGSQR